MRSRSLYTALAFALCAVATSGSEATCNSFSITNLDGVSLVSATHFATNATVSFRNLVSSINTNTLPAFCRVQIQIITNATAGSFTVSEVWLPDDWNNRMLSFGNGAFGGGISVSDLGFIGVRQGFASMSTDTGHNSTGIDGTWALNNPNAVFDWGFRAMHLSVVAAKQVVSQYYETAATKSYYLGCSTGGRQGLKEIQDFPEDFDGIVIGSPANWHTHLIAWEAHMNQIVQPTTSPRFMTSSQWINVIAPEVLRQCDELDGLADGIISDPRVCRFRPETLTCTPGQDPSTCLTGPQVVAVRHVYADYFEANQRYIFGTYYPGGELQFATGGYLGSAPDQLAITYYENFVLNSTGFTIADYNVTLLDLDISINPGQAVAINPNISEFAGPSHNGKVIHYVGWADQLISPGNSLHYYETVHTFMQEHTGMNIDDFYRLFPVGGMTHCSGGTGANSFGQDDNKPIADDPQHNVVSAIVRWVEEGVAPENITAAHFNNNNAAQGVNFTRPVCMYPLSTVFKGGDPDDASSFECATLA